ncbi:MAG TPA: ABC transporter ATP-binding protein [Micropepsaceae bacterium]|nr:ABC transporter ATP-binding protein [Micropepsaceae bacterium]
MILGNLRAVAQTFRQGNAALGPFDLEIQSGEFLSLLGPSGCGKSTALRIIAGLLTPTRGEVIWHTAKPAIGYVFQDPTLMPWATVHQNIRLPLDLASVPRPQADERAAAALARVGLKPRHADEYPRALSGGMRMRVSIARALAAKPSLLLMDEPFAALDEISRDSLNEDLLRLWREDQLTVIFVTHSVFESAFLSTRVVALTPGPGRIAGAIDIAGPALRSGEWRMSPGYSETVRQISKLLRDGMKAAA